MAHSICIGFGDFIAFILASHQPNEASVLTPNIETWQATIHEAFRSYGNVFPNEFGCIEFAQGSDGVFRSRQVGDLLHLYLGSKVLDQGDGGHVYRLNPDTKQFMIGQVGETIRQVGNPAGLSGLVQLFAHNLCIPDPPEPVSTKRKSRPKAPVGTGNFSY